MIEKKEWIYNLHGVRQLENNMMQSIPASTLMQRAGHAAFQYILHHYSFAKNIAIYCGAGNNGGDGYALALELFAFGKSVCVIQVEHTHAKTQIAEKLREACLNQKIPIFAFSNNIQFPWSHCDLQVDAILGIGAKKPFSEELNQVLNWMNNQEIPIFSLDVPTGIDAQTGLALTENPIQADRTLSFLAWKLGLLQGDAIVSCGELNCDDLGVPDCDSLNENKQSCAVAEILFPKKLKKRPRDMHKGQAGHVLIIGSDQGYLGASRLAGMAALRSGAGKVSILTHPSHAAVLQANCAELMVFGVQEPRELKPFIEKADVMILGVGLGRSAWSQSLFDVAIACDIPSVIDADGLYFLSLKKYENKKNKILTPHPLEAARLLSSTTQIVQANRLDSLQKIVSQYQASVVLKGARTQVGAPNQLPAICLQGNPGMASAGMGDVLSGIIASMCAQGMSAFDAAKQGVFYHAAASDCLAQMRGEIGMLASDVIEMLPKVINGKF